MKQVSKEEFYAYVMDKPATVHVMGDYPFTAEYRAHGVVIGKSVDEYADGHKEPIITTYYINA